MVFISEFVAAVIQKAVVFASRPISHDINVALLYSFYNISVIAVRLRVGLTVLSVSSVTGNSVCSRFDERIPRKRLH